MDVKHLKNFVGIVDSGSFTKAAERLFIAQPSLSLQLHALEAELKTQLLIRSSQGVQLTEAGKTLYRHARLVLRQLETARQEVQHGGGSEAGPVVVGFPTTIASILGVPLFYRVRERFPGIRLQLFESMSGYVSELLANGRLDLAVLFRDSETRGISVLPVFDEELYVLGDSHPEIQNCGENCSIDKLADVPLVVPSATNGLRLLIERSFSSAHVELNIVADIDSLPMLIEIAKLGPAHTMLPASALASCAPAMCPRARRITAPEIRRPASICWSNSLPVGLPVLAVRQCIADLVGELKTSGCWTGITLRG